MNPRKNPQPLADLRFALVGAGRVGGSLANWLVAAGAELSAVSSRGSESAHELCRQLGGSSVAVEQLASASLDLLLLAVPDHQLEGLALTLSARPQAKAVFHTAGALPATVLSALGAQGSSVATFHPLKAFPRVLPSLEDAQGVVFGLEGGGPALELAARLLSAWGAEGVIVPAEKRRLYHFAASVAAGGVVTLVALATEICRRLQLPPMVAAGYLELAQGALREVDPSRPAEAITGPVARGEAAAITAALDDLEQQAPDLVPFAASLLAQTARQLELGAGSSPGSQSTSALRRIMGYLASRHDSGPSRTSEVRSPEERELSP